MRSITVRLDFRCMLLPNAQRHLKTVAEHQSAFAASPAAIARTQEITDRCNFSLSDLRYEYPEELAPEGKTPFEHLSDLTEKGVAKRYPEGVPARVTNQIQHELKLIQDLRYEAYFLTVWDLVRFARKQGILCQGRGSAANSAVCYCLGVTSVDPATTDLLFERFISKERDEAPDIERSRSSGVGGDGGHLSNPQCRSRRRKSAGAVAGPDRCVGQAGRKLFLGI